MPNISEIIQTATEILRIEGIAEPRREANSLLSLALKKDKTFLIAHSEYELTEGEENLFWKFIKRRSNHEPFQHIAGKQEFWRLDFVVTPDVMIPRPETEMIVETGVEILRNLKNPKFCEIGIGSGCISVSILHDLTSANAFSFDISEKALKIAKLNAENNGVLDRLNLDVSNVFENVDEKNKFDLIVSNPPYVPSEDVPRLQAEVRDFDPHVALTDGKDGLSIVKQIIDESPNYLKPKAFLLMEIGFNQSNKVRQMFNFEIWQSLEFLPDLQGIPRMVKAQIK